MSSPASSTVPVAVVLAAGKGTRMRSERPKVLHEVAGKPLLAWVLDAARRAGCERCLVVVGHGGDEVREALPDPDIEWVVQTEQRGTGHALAQARAAVGDAERVLVLSGDVPAVRSETLSDLLEVADGAWGAITIARMAEPGALGRVVTDDGGRLKRIVEAADATPEELAFQTINAGIYVLPAPSIFDYLAGVRPDNAKGELYLTDALVAAAVENEIRTLTLEDSREALGVNTRRDLAAVQNVLVRRHLELLMDRGVTIHDPLRTVIEPSVTVGRDCEIHPGVTLAGDTSLGEGCVVHAGAWIRDSTVGAEVSIYPYSVLDGAMVGEQVSIGPFARLRPGADLADDVRVGNFVEIKNARLERGVKAGHLAYLGDAEVGEEANIGAGTVTCNYDGEKKHRTRIGSKAFIGSDTMLVAPVEIGEEATTGAGSTITSDVPDGALGVSRSKQRNIRGWTNRRKRD